MTRTRDHEGVTLRTWSSGNLSRGHDRTKPGLILVYPSRSFDTDCGHKSRRVPRSFVIMSAETSSNMLYYVVSSLEPTKVLSKLYPPARGHTVSPIISLLLLAIHPSVMGWIFWIDDNGVSLFRNLFFSCFFSSSNFFASFFSPA